MRTRLETIVAVAAGVLLLVLSPPVFATHKTWQLKNTGAQCSFTSYSVDHPLANYMDIQNWDSAVQFAVCPVTLSARWGASASPLGSFGPARWAAAISSKAIIENNNTTGSPFDCLVRARMANESIRFSATASTNTVGKKALQMATHNNWGGDLEAHDTETVRSMDFDCRIPGTANLAAPSRIVAYQVKICQARSSAATCDTPDDANEGDPDQLPDWDGDYAYVQTSGIECEAADYSFATDLTRNYSGVTNNVTYLMNVFCPLTQPSDDSWWHVRTADQTRVYVSGSDAASMTCSLVWARHSSLYVTVTGSKLLTYNATGGYFEQLGGTSIGHDVATGVNCTLPPGMTVKGVTSLMTETRISDGI